MKIRFLFWEIQLPDTIGIDKVLHFSVCFWLCTLLSLIFGIFMNQGNAFAYALIATMVIGFAKELVDSIRGGIFDSYDLIADWLGMCFSAFTILPYIIK